MSKFGINMHACAHVLDLLMRGVGLVPDQGHLRRSFPEFVRFGNVVVVLVDACAYV